MNKTLINQIKGQLFKAVSGITQHVYFIYVPNKDGIKTEFNVVFELLTKDITHSFNQKEIVTGYEAVILINYPKYEPICDYAVFIKDKVYELVNINPSVTTVNLTDEALEFENDILCYQGLLRFDVQYTK